MTFNASLQGVRMIDVLVCMFLVAANFVRLGKLKIGSDEMAITEFTGNIHEFPALPDDSEQVRELSEHVHDMNAQLDEKHLECTSGVMC